VNSAKNWEWIPNQCIDNLQGQMKVERHKLFSIGSAVIADVLIASFTSLSPLGSHNYAKDTQIFLGINDRFSLTQAFF
jgi:hypothetical protein